MRSIEYLIALFPDKTGVELLEIQKQDKIKDEENFKKANSKKLATIEDINTNGGYFRGVFGLTQRFYYSFSNLRLMEGKIICDCTHLVCFFENNSIFNCEIREDSWKEFENYGVSIYERVSKEDFNKAVYYFTSSKELLW